MRIPRLLATSLVLASTSGCSVRSWNDFETGSSVPVIESGSPFPAQTFGTLLTSQSTVLTDGTRVSRLIVGSGRIDASASTDGMFASYTGWNDTRLDLGRQLYAHCAGPNPVCPDDAGSALAAIPDLSDRRRCVLAGAPDLGAESMVVSCEESDTSAFPVILQLGTGAPPGSRIGASLAAIPASASTLGVALAGAPGDGSIWTMDANGGFAALPLVGATPAVGFGTAIATAPVTTTDAALLAKLPAGDERAFVAVASPGENRVYVLVARTQSSLASDAVVLGCIDGPIPASPGVDGFGAVLAAGDLTGDGLPEVAIGARITASVRDDQVRIVSLADFDVGAGLAIGCGDPTSADDPPVHLLGCTPDLDARNASCSGFGGSLAIGEANGDGFSDLLVGAPLASVGDVSHAGAAYLVRGAASLDVFVSSTNTPAVLVDSHPDINDTLGIAVTFLASQLTPADADLRGQPRAEPVAAAPGANRVFVFLCSGLPGDDLPEGVPRCIVEL